MIREAGLWLCFLFGQPTSMDAHLRLFHPAINVYLGVFHPALVDAANADDVSRTLKVFERPRHIIQRFRVLAKSL
jgi:hypothetical protein